MNRRLCVWVVSILTGISGLTGTPRLAMGQASPPTPPLAPPAPATVGGLPAGVQGNPLLSGPDKLAVSKFVGDECALLVSSDPVIQSTARKALIAQLGRGSTQSYYSSFAAAWDTAALKALDKPSSVSVRLNLAIVTSTLVENGGVNQPATLISKLLSDTEPCVSLWGIKAARSLVLIELQLPPGANNLTKTTTAIVDAVKRHGRSEIAGILTTEAYGALVLDQNHNIPGFSTAQVDAVAPPLVQPIIDILEFRLGQYQAGVPTDNGKLAAPQSPGAEHSIGTFLFHYHTDPAVSPALQKKIVQDLVTLMTYIGQRAALYQYDKGAQAEIRETLRYTASALQQMLQQVAPNQVSSFRWFEPPPTDFNAADVLKNTALVYGYMAKVPTYNFLAQPPVVVPIEPPSPPPTAKPAGAPPTP